MTTKKTQNEPPPRQETATTLRTEAELQRDAKETTAKSQDGAFSTNLASALKAAQSEVRNATFNRFNSHFKSRYADLVEVRECVVPVFLKHGLVILQSPNVDGEAGFHLETILMHTSGEQLRFRFPLPDPAKIQSVGASITYARRYVYTALGGIASEDDLDGNETLQNTNGGGQSTTGGGKNTAGHFL